MIKDDLWKLLDFAVGFDYFTLSTKFFKEQIFPAAFYQILFGLPCVNQSSTFCYFFDLKLAWHCFAKVLILTETFHLWCATYTVSNKNLADFETYVFRGYLRNHLSYKKVFYIYLHSCLKSFQMKKLFFKSGNKISWYL